MEVRDEIRRIWKNADMCEKVQNKCSFVLYFFCGWWYTIKATQNPCDSSRSKERFSYATVQFTSSIPAHRRPAGGH